MNIVTMPIYQDIPKATDGQNAHFFARPGNYLRNRITFVSLPVEITLQARYESIDSHKTVFFINE